MEIKILKKEELRGRLSCFCDLYRACFSGYIDEEIVSQRFIDNPFDSEILMCIAEDEGKIVANYSAMPCEVWCGEKKMKSALVCNIMTHPDYSGKGLFVKLANLLHEEMKSRGYSFAYVFPNLYSNKTITHSLNWQDVYEIPTMQKNLENLNGNFSRFVSNIYEILPEHIKWQSVDKFCVGKSYDYIKWRYVDNAGDYKFFGLKENWAIIKGYQDELNITEFHCKDEDCEEFLAALIAVAKGNGYKKITGWAHINSHLHYAMERLGFFVTSPVRYFAVKTFCDNLPCDAYDFRNWHLCMGDDNVY